MAAAEPAPTKEMLVTLAANELAEQADADIFLFN